MASPQVDITHAITFSASHRLYNPRLSAEENQRLFGVCTRLHGHNYRLEATVRGPVPAETGMVMNLTILGQILREEIYDEVDHRNLTEDVPALDGVVVTAETLAVHAWGRITSRLGKHPGVALVRVRVYESDDVYVDYTGD